MRARTLAGATIAALAAGSAIALPSGAAPGGARAAGGHTVVLKNIRFNPGSIRIHRGDTVTWMWRDGPIAHNVTGGGFKSRTMSKGSFTVRFTRKGTFNYHCSIHWHQGMTGKIVVS
ncbi:MAG: plastocyanin/azurin family copper-binding protein [Solirubrobacteraceae bacterium]